MATNRQYESAMIFNVRCVDMRHLWNPSTEYLGKPMQKPNYFATFITPKTQGHWSQEPVFGGAMQAFQKMLQGQLQAFANNPNSVTWPIADGDVPGPSGKSSEFAKGHWLFSASTSSMPNVELTQTGGQLTKLHQRVGVKPGDFCMAGVTAAVKSNQPNGAKFYLNAVVFTHPGEEIVFANSVSGAELMRAAEAQGFKPTGFSPAQGGFGGGALGGYFSTPGNGFAPDGAAPQPGYVPATAFPSNPGFGSPPNFSPASASGNNPWGR